METKINSLNDGLAFLLQGLYFTERKLAYKFTTCCSQVSSTKLTNLIRSYTDTSQDKMTKIERIFSYLMTEPMSRTNNVVNALMEETYQMVDSANSFYMKDILTIACVQNINAYKIAGYRSAYLFAAELELDTATDLIHQILESERETRRLLNELSIEEFNDLQRAASKD